MLYEVITNSWLPKLMNQAGYPLGSSLSFLLTLYIDSKEGELNIYYNIFV